MELKNCCLNRQARPNQAWKPILLDRGFLENKTGVITPPQLFIATPSPHFLAIRSTLCACTAPGKVATGENTMLSRGCLRLGDAIGPAAVRTLFSKNGPVFVFAACRLGLIWMEKFYCHQTTCKGALLETFRMFLSGSRRRCQWSPKGGLATTVD